MWNLLFVGEPSWSIVVHSAADVERFFKETVENRFLFLILNRQLQFLSLSIKDFLLRFFVGGVF